MADLGITPESTIEKMVQERLERERQRAIIVENEKEWAKAANQLFGGRNGKLFIKYLLRMNGLFTVETSRDMTKLLEDRGAKNVYLALIRPYLTPELLAELETQR
jgi:hypothetical protein